MRPLGPVTDWEVAHLWHWDFYVVVSWFLNVTSHPFRVPSAFKLINYAFTIHVDIYNESVVSII